MCIHVCLVWSVFPTAFRVPHHLPVCRHLHTDSPAQLDSIWTWRNAHMRSEGSSPTGDRTRVARSAVQCSTDWATPSTTDNIKYIVFHLVFSFLLSLVIINNFISEIISLAFSDSRFQVQIGYYKILVADKEARFLLLYLPTLNKAYCIVWNFF